MKKLLFVSLLFVATAGFAQTKPSMKLWYKAPAGAPGVGRVDTTWEKALPIGNGHLGAMIYGNVQKETIQLNEHTVWSGSPNRNDNPMAKDSLAKIRELIFAGKQKDAELPVKLLSLNYLMAKNLSLLVVYNWLLRGMIILPTITGNWILKKQ
jgi:alpha-L-fucosidase 2